MKPCTPVLVIHGGTGDRPDAARLQRIRRSLQQIAKSAYAYLESHTALETAAHAVCLLEDDPLYNAGTGSVLQRDGRVRMSASVMDGQTMGFGGVLNIERVRNPVLVAKALVGRAGRLLAAGGALRFARAQGFGAWDPVTAERKRQWQRRVKVSHGTVGAVALDASGRLAAATSTGGRGFEWPGRVSDSGLPIGNYACAEVAISCTGVGEEIIEEGLAVRLASRVIDGQPLSRALRRTFAEARKRRRLLGLISLDTKGRWAWDTTLPILFAIGRRGAETVEAF